MAQKSQSTVQNGQHIITGGLVLQLLAFGFFVAVALVFHVRINKSSTADASSRSIPWRKHIYTLYAASVLIVVRSVFRVIEFVQGNDGYIMQHEIFFYLFDAVLMLAVMVLFNLIHPSEIKALLRGGQFCQKGFQMRGGV
jgi:hypothetical protein